MERLPCETASCLYRLCKNRDCLRFIKKSDWVESWTRPLIPLSALKGVIFMINCDLQRLSGKIVPV